MPARDAKPRYAAASAVVRYCRTVSGATLTRPSCPGGSRLTMRGDDMREMAG